MNKYNRQCVFLTAQKHEEVFDLPEDPDFSILKLPIAGGVSATGVAGPALLLTTATDEVGSKHYRTAVLILMLIYLIVCFPELF